MTIKIHLLIKAGRAFTGQTLTFPVGATTTVEAHAGGIVNGDPDSVQVRGASGVNAGGLRTLTPKRIEDDAGDSD